MMLLIFLATLVIALLAQWHVNALEQFMSGSPWPDQPDRTTPRPTGIAGWSVASSDSDRLCQA